MEMFEVGGCVRDELLGLPSKDIDFSVVLTKADEFKRSKAFHGVPSPFDFMVIELKHMGFKVFLETPEHLTVRARFPRLTVINGKPAKATNRPGLTADFVLARKESGYTDGRRPDFVEPGTLLDDLSRRDFTMNAIAKAADGSLIDPFNGQVDIHNKMIRAVGDAFERLNEDALRAVRALRFSVTKGFTISTSVQFAMESAAVLDSIVNNISDERIKDELSKMFHFDTMESLRALQAFPSLTNAMFSGSVNLDATMKQKGFNK